MAQTSKYFYSFVIFLQLDKIVAKKIYKIKTKKIVVKMHLGEKWSIPQLNTDTRSDRQAVRQNGQNWWWLKILVVDIDEDSSQYFLNVGIDI